MPLMVVTNELNGSTSIHVQKLLCVHCTRIYGAYKNKNVPFNSDNRVLSFLVIFAYLASQLLFMDLCFILAQLYCNSLLA